MVGAEQQPPTRRRHNKYDLDFIINNISIIENLFKNCRQSKGAGQDSSFALVKTARRAVRTPRRGFPASEEFCHAPSVKPTATGFPSANGIAPSVKREMQIAGREVVRFVNGDAAQAQLSRTRMPHSNQTACHHCVAARGWCGRGRCRARVLAFQGVAALPPVVAQFTVNGASAVKYYSGKAPQSRLCRSRETKNSRDVAWPGTPRPNRWHGAPVTVCHTRGWPTTWPAKNSRSNS